MIKKSNVCALENIGKNISDQMNFWRMSRISSNFSIFQIMYLYLKYILIMILPTNIVSFAEASPMLRINRPWLLGLLFMLIISGSAANVGNLTFPDSRHGYLIFQGEIIYFLSEFRGKQILDSIFFRDQILVQLELLGKIE